MILSAASEWDGKAAASLEFTGASGSLFRVFGGDDLIVEVKYSSGF